MITVVTSPSDSYLNQYRLFYLTRQYLRPFNLSVDTVAMFDVVIEWVVRGNSCVVTVMGGVSSGVTAVLLR